jgi:hypothetical protein
MTEFISELEQRISTLSYTFIVIASEAMSSR